MAIGGTLLCVANFPSGTGFAWDFIGALYAGLADRLREHGVETLVAYPAMDGVPDALADSSARPILLPIDLGRPRSVAGLIRVVRRQGVRWLYLSDRPSWHPTYSLLRLAGVRTIVVHDHTSGDRTVPVGPKRWLKRLRHRLPGSVADVVIAVSDFVADRKRDVDLIPRDRVVRLWNSVVIPPTPEETGTVGQAARPSDRFDFPPGTRLVGCAARAAPEKGIQHLLRAFDRVCTSWRGEPLPGLIYMGDGPHLPELRRLCASLRHRDRVRMPGYLPDAADVLGRVDVAVVPSVWQEAFGLAVLEPMSRGIPVVASAVGGIPEVVRDGKEGVLVAPGDENALARSITALLLDDDARAGLGRAGRRRAVECFSRETQLAELTRIFLRAMV